MTFRRPLVLFVLCTGVFLAAIDSHLVNVAFPAMLRDFPGSDLAELSWVFNGYTITFTAALLPAGGLADRFGHRRIYLAGLAVFVAAGTVCAVAPSPGVLIAARVVQGIGGGTMTPLALALIMPCFPGERQGTAIGLWSASQSIAIASGPALGGGLVSAWGWRTIFLLHLPIGLIVLIGTWRAVPRDPATDPATGPTRRLPDLLGAGLLVAAIGLPSLAVVQSHDWGIVSPRTAAAFAAGVIVSVLFVRRTRRHAAPVVDLRILRTPGTRRANLAMFLLGLVMFTWTITIAIFLAEVQGRDAAATGLALTPGPVMQAAIAIVAGRLMSRFGHRTLALSGVLLLAAAELTLASMAGPRTSYAGVVLPALLMAGAGITMLINALSAAAVAEVPSDRLATGTALSVTSRACAAVIGLSGVALILSGEPVGSAGAYRVVWGTMAGLCVVLGLVAARLRVPGATPSRQGASAGTEQSDPAAPEIAPPPGSRG
ncbi:DHA2 family efflux MFS transporter permease subunit, partial [Actinomadura sp. HBU206391]|uniref:DHA2 family efflux MFS transporter permease subunit n=1 Tax=Actinomadura sp. HBU206391 TaxID=2731692 RepID=UPI0016506EF6